MKDKKKRIAVIGLKGLPAFGGAAAVYENIISQLKDKYDITVYSTSSHTDEETGPYDGYNQIVFKSIKHQGLNFLWYFLQSAFHCVCWEDYDLVHVHHLAGAFCIPLLRLKYKNVVVTSHGMPDKTKKWPIIAPIYYPIMRFILAKFSKMITTVSELDAKYYQPYTSEKIVYIPNGINVIDINQPKTKEKPDIFFAAGRIMPTKGCHILLKALHNIEYDGNLFIAGDLNQIESYKKKLFSLSKNLKAIFLGLIKDKSLLLGYIQQAKYFVFPSSVEAMSMMLLESALTKTPIIASDIPENRAVFTPEEALFFQVDNIEDLSAKLLFAFENTEIMQQKALRAYQRVVEEYNVVNIAPRYGCLYEKLLSNE